jgi:hypothetical protein
MDDLKKLLNEIWGIGGVVTQKPINSMSLRDLVEEKWVGEEDRKVDTGTFLEEVSKYGKLGELIYRDTPLRDVAKGLSELCQKAKAHTLQETDDWFDRITINKNMKMLENQSHEFIKIAKDANALQQRMEGLYEDMGHILNRYYDISEDVPNDHTVAEGKYQDFFAKALKKFGASSPADMDDEKKKKFFNWIDDNYKSEIEKS